VRTVRPNWRATVHVSSPARKDVPVKWRVGVTSTGWCHETVADKNQSTRHARKLAAGSNNELRPYLELEEAVPAALRAALVTLGAKPESLQTASVILLPAHGYSFLLGSATLSNFAFDVDVVGHVHIPTMYTGLAGGEGTPVLSLYGFPITISAAQGISPLTLFNLIGNALPLSNLRTNTLHLLPVNPGARYLLELDDGQTFGFNIDLGGHLLIDPSMDPYLAGAGSSALYVRRHVLP
jgi:hypothetical protein